MSEDLSVVTDAVTNAVTKASTSGSSSDTTAGAEALQQMDSLGLMIAFADIQGALGMEFEPEHLMQLFLCRSIEEMVAVISQITASK